MEPTCLGNKLPRSPFKPRRKTNYLKLLIGVLNKKGERATAESIVFKVLSQIRETGRDPYTTVTEAIEALKPLAELQNKIVGGVNYRIPSPLVADKATSIAMRWLVTSAHERPEKSMAKKLYAEIADILQGKGYAMKKREDHHKQVVANRAFMRFLR